MTQEDLVAKNKIIRITDALDSRKDTPIMVPRHWLLMTHDMRNMYILMPDPYAWWNCNFLRE